MAEKDEAKAFLDAMASIPIIKVPMYFAGSAIMKRVAKTWGLILSANRQDLQDCKNALPAGGDPWIEVIEVDVVLRSASFDGMALSDAIEYGRQLLRVVNGAMLAIGARTALDFEGILEFQPGKRKPERHEFGKMEWKGFADALRRTRFDDPLDRSRAPSRTQRWIAKAASAPELADALMFLSGEFDWFDVYKVLECLEWRYGGEHQFRRMKWVPGNYKKLKRSADWTRHWRRSEEKLDGALTLRAARSQTINLLRAALDQRPPSRSRATKKKTARSKSKA
jgi:hypothetical protein